MGRPLSIDKLQDNGDLLSAEASTITHVAFHHCLNTVINKSSTKVVLQASRDKERQKKVGRTSK